MTAKRYFKRMWEDEFYIFDSETISEKEFDEKVEYEDYQAFADSMLGDEVVKLLNEQHETIQRLNQNIDELISVNVEEELLKENEQLKTKNNAYIQDIEVFKEENTHLKLENEQLKQQMQRLYNYFADWFDDRVRPSDFSEMWDFVKEDEKWD